MIVSPPLIDQLKEDGVKLHKRTEAVRIAAAEISASVTRASVSFGCTPAEIVSILAHEAASWAKYVLRMERHGDYDTPADEEGEP